MSPVRTTILTGLFILAASSASAGLLYVSDESLDTVEVFDSTTGAPTATLTPSRGWGIPSGIAIAANGDVYVADELYNVVDQFSAGGAFLSTFVSSGPFSPTGLAFGPDGNLYVASLGSGGNSYIERYDSSGNPVDGTPFVPSSTGLYDPGAIAFGPDGNLYIADSSNDAIDQVTLPSGAFSTLVSAGCPATPFANPQGVAFGPSNNLYVSDEGYGCGSAPFGVYEYDTSGNLLGTLVLPNTLSTPVDLAFGPDGNLYVTDANARVAAFDGVTGAELADLVAPGTLVNPTFLAFTAATSAVPEPATFGLVGLGLALLVLRFLRLRRPSAL